MKIDSFTPETVPELTEEQAAKLEADLRKIEAAEKAYYDSLTDEEAAHQDEWVERPDSEIDTSDIPVLTAEQWKKGIRGRFYRPVKRQITARVDADVLEWLKAQGKGYQSRINAILRREMLTAVKAAK